MQNTIFGDERTSAVVTPASQQHDKDATSSAKTTAQETRSRGANDDKSTERLPQQVGAGKLPRTVQRMGAGAQGATGLDKSRKSKETNELNTERRNHATLNSPATGGMPDSQIRESADASQKENKNPKYRGVGGTSSPTPANGNAESPFQCDSAQ